MKDQYSNERLNPLADIVFSCIFQDMQGAPAMKEIINAILLEAGDEQIDEIVEMKSQDPQASDQNDDEAGCLYVKARVSDGTLLDIKVQVNPGRNMNDKEVVCFFRKMGGYGKSEKEIRNMPKVRVISFMDFVQRHDSPDILQPISFMSTGKQVTEATDIFRMYNVEMPKFTAEYDSIEAVDGKNPMYQWLYALTKGYQSEEEMEMLENRTEGMGNFSTLYRKANADQNLRDKYEYQRSQRMD